MSEAEGSRRAPRAVVAAVWAVLALLLVVALPAHPAAADAPAASGWWSQASSLPPPPDVSSDGLYVQGGPSGPVAISALRFSLPEGQTPKKLVLVPNGVASPSAAVQVCPLKTASEQFKPAQNGAWADAPAYDCDAKLAVVGTADDAGTLTFDVAALADGGTLAVAVIATGASDRVPIAKPDASALTTEASPTASSASTDTASTYSPVDSTYTAPETGSASSTGSGSVALPPVAAPNVPSQSAAATPESSAAAGASTPSADHPLAITGTSSNDLATRLGGLAAIAILIAALIAYSLGYGLLGGRFVDS